MIRPAVSVLAVAAAALGWSAWNAWHVDGVSDATFQGRAAAVNEARTRAANGYDLARVLGAVEKDPFRTDRRRPPQRFRARGDPVNASRAASTPAPAVELIGTAVSPDGGFAVCAVGGASPKIVRIGERVGAWTLSRVTNGAAEFATANGATVVLRIAKAGT